MQIRKSCRHIPNESDQIIEETWTKKFTESSEEEVGGGDRKSEKQIEVKWAQKEAEPFLIYSYCFSF